ncbi:MAG: DNA primase, partial [Deltaproteobacteria bacterium]|nr:DNA primase [Deltaproteobacteria bacterium]
MPRIPEQTVEQLKQLPLAALVERSGVALARRGKDLVASCPFHEEDTPSLFISVSKNVFNCFGCDAGGSPIDWVMRFEKLAFREAVAFLQKDSGLHLCPLDVNATGPQLLSQTAKFYHDALKHDESALSYLEERGLNDAKLIAHFQLGVCNRSLGTLLPRRDRKTGEELR